ncbi:hypothetical protein BJF78_21055 [Pseudonocardia sp. CNS-139]|nr:hypothetical protein BJF78_21055 [Pseudonocardia sp. CNS-139]
MRDRRRARRALALLAVLLTGRTVFTLDEAAGAVTIAADGSAGEDFLGLVDGPHLRAVLVRGFTDLRAEGVVRAVDDRRITHDLTATRATLARLRDHRWPDRAASARLGQSVEPEGGPSR